jgi:phage internal scaffolding protein
MNETCKFRTGYESDYSSKKYDTPVVGESLTQQEFANECDVNLIVGKWAQTGVLPNANATVGDYLDLSDVPTFHEAQNVFVRANEMFMALPADVRVEFGNDPAKFLAAVHDEKQHKRLYELGVFRAPVPAVPLEVVIKADAKSASVTEVGSSKG